MNLPTPVKCTACGQPDDLRCPCVDSVEAVWAGAAPRPTDPQPEAAELIHDLLEAIYAGYYVVDRP